MIKIYVTNKIIDKILKIVGIYRFAMKASLDNYRVIVFRNIMKRLMQKVLKWLYTS